MSTGNSVQPRKLATILPVRKNWAARPQPADHRTELPSVLRSLKDVHKASAVGAVLGLGSSPDPGAGAGVRADHYFARSARFAEYGYLEDVGG
jgi:hypothetical protein